MLKCMHKEKERQTKSDQIVSRSPKFGANNKHKEEAGGQGPNWRVRKAQGEIKWGETKRQDSRVHVEHGMDLEIQKLHWQGVIDIEV